MVRLRVRTSLAIAAALALFGCSERAPNGLSDLGVPDGGGGLDAGPRDGGGDVDGGPASDGGSSDGGSVDDGGPTVDFGPVLCPVAVLGCDSGTVTGHTGAGAPRVNGWGSCGESTTGYTGAESAYTFATGVATSQGVTIVVDGATTTDDYDLFVTEGDTTTCDGAGTCAASSAGSSADETVRFMAAPGQTFAVYYDRFETTPGTTAFSLTVTCATVTCGDGALAAGFETCDDGNTTPGDGCDGTCAAEDGWTCTGTPSVCTRDCGNSVIDLSEDCDDGNTTPGDGCDATCFLETGFECIGEPSVCHRIVCGDGLIDYVAEDCDDHNTTPGDGCSDLCAVELGFDCTGEPSVCVSTCGNGVRDLGEQCDDNNAIATDGCAECVVQPGFGCVGEPSVCTAYICGDSLVQGGESCDDGNLTPGDGCNATCQVETFTPTAAPGASVVLTGNLALSTTTFTRPYADCSGPSLDTVHYQTFVIENTTATAQRLTLTAAWGGDGYLFVYQPSFVPAAPLDRCLVGDDDFGAADGSQIVSVIVPAGQQRIVVATTYADAAAALAPYTITIDTL
jgi:cysteine-rich repeat protein